MRSKLLIVSALAAVSMVVLVAVVAVTAYALVSSGPVQAEEAVIDNSVNVAPVEVQAVSQPQLEKPAVKYERASYAGHEGGCPFGASKAQFTQAPSEPAIENDLLTLAQ